MGAPKPPTAPAATTPTAEKQANGLKSMKEIRAKQGRRVLIYGDAGVGKSTLATKLGCKTLYFDLEGTVPDLFDEIPENITNVRPDSWETMMEWLTNKNVGNYEAVVVDSLTALESMWLEFVLTHARKAPEGYGAVVFNDKPLPRLKDERELGGGGGDSARYACWCEFERIMWEIVYKGIHFINLCHVVDEQRDDASEGANIVHAPRLQHPNNRTGKNSIRKRAIETHGEVWYMKWETTRKDDLHISKTGKRIVLGQPNDENAADFDGVESKSRRGFSRAYLDEFDINAILGINNNNTNKGE